MLHAHELRHLKFMYRHVPNLACNESHALLAQIIHDPVFVMTQIMPALSQIGFGREPAIVASYSIQESSTCLQVFTWPAGATTAIHDHTSIIRPGAPTSVWLEPWWRSATCGSTTARSPARRAYANYGSAHGCRKMVF